MKRARRRFNPEFKQEAVELVRRSDKSANQIARELGISQTTLSRWLRAAGSVPEGENVFATQEELKRLQKENERLLVKIRGIHRVFQGLPGSMKKVLTPAAPNHSRTARVVNSAPLSDRMCHINIHAFCQPDPFPPACD